MKRVRRLARYLGLATAILVMGGLFGRPALGVEPGGPGGPRAAEYADQVRPLLATYCLGCHSTKAKKGSLDLERFATVGQLRRETKVWQGVVEQVEAGEMPPKAKPQPTAEERKRLTGWVRGLLDEEARGRAGDPGHVPLRRLSNAEYDATVRDLTGVDLRPAREFPADGAAGEGFTNAAESLADMSPVLFDKYLAAAKDVAAHAVLLPDGFRFSPARTRRDWTDESLARLREFYKDYSADGQLPLRPYLAATVRHRDALLAGTTTPEAVAAKEKLNAKYFRALWGALTGAGASFPLDTVRAQWRQATEKDVDGIAADVARWQASLWKTVPIGSYRYGNTVRGVANDPAAAASRTLRVKLDPAPGQSEVVVSLAARAIGAGKDGYAVLHRPRLEGGGGPALLLRDYASFGPRHEIDLPAVFAGTGRYLAAVARAAHEKADLRELAAREGLDAGLLGRWAEVAAVLPRKSGETREPTSRLVPAEGLGLLAEKSPRNDNKPVINGWRRAGSDLPIVVSNASADVHTIPGRIGPHGVAVHPTPGEYVAVAWTSPIEGKVRVAGRVAHAHPACGNGVAWWLEQRGKGPGAGRAAVLAEGALDLGAAADLPARELAVARGDTLVLAVDARGGDHSCDLTEIALTVTEVAAPGRAWDLAGDVADTILEGNPHADRHGHKAVWSFVRAGTRTAGQRATPGRPGGPVVPPDSVLGRWREAAADPARREEAARLAGEVQKLLSGPRPAQEKSPDRVLYDNLVSAGGVLLRGLEVPSARSKAPERFGLPRERFGRHLKSGAVDDASVVVPLGTGLEVRLPAALVVGRELVVDGRPDAGSADEVLLFQAAAAPLPADARWDGQSPVVAAPGGKAHQALLGGFADFRRLFPLYLCYPHVIPLDEVVCLKMYHREDEPLERLFLDDAAKARLDRLWQEHRFISQQPVAEYKYLPQFIGFVTQDQPKELLNYFEGQREPFRLRAVAFEKDLRDAEPAQWTALLDFAARAYRRPLADQDRVDLRRLYDALRAKGAEHDEAFRGVLARVLVSPAFLYHVEAAPPGTAAGPVDDWELAARLSYFLWSSAPDDPLRRLAAAGKLREPGVLEEQARRMLADPRARALAVEFGAQWLHVRGFNDLKEKNEKLFPTFDQALRDAINEETVRFFLDLFQQDRPARAILDADYTYLNETLAKHYGIPGVKGSEWRRVEGVRKSGRGGILTLASVLAKESGASRTSPVLRGNWVVETLLGEKLPKPPPNVPRLPEEEAGTEKTMRQLVEMHTRAPECATCHVRIDPFGFAFERYDPIGRLREKDLGGRPVDARVRLRDGTEFDGLDGLRAYLLEKKQDVIVRLFCQRLLGYALGRQTALSDSALIDQMAAALRAENGRVADAVRLIAASPQFRTIRGRDFDPESH